MIQIGKIFTAFTLAAQIIDMMLDAPILGAFFRNAGPVWLLASIGPVFSAYVCIGLFISRVFDRALGE